jgi:GT2 family glycosyltransferase
MQPLVTVNILSYNRKDDLRNTLRNVYEQDYKNIEVMVVDNHSNDGSVEMVKAEYPAVRLLELQENIGIAGWNEGANIAKGEYLLFLDDDSYPAQQTLSSVLSQCDESTIVALDIRSPNGDSYARDPLKPILYPTFIGCGVIIPRKIFISLDGFEPLLFLYAHEEEFSMRAMQLGYTIRSIPNAIVYHVCSRKNRLMTEKRYIDKRRLYYQNRNVLLLFLFHFSFSKIVFRVLRMCAGRILFSIYSHSFVSVFCGLCAGVIVAIRNWNKRFILDDEIQRLYGYGKYFGSFFTNEEFGFKRPRWL